jgi:hypothetical protein
MWARALVRGFAETDADEIFIIEHTDGVWGDETVRITGMGRSQTFTGVRNIYANTGSGNDQLLVKEGVLADASSGVAPATTS